MMFNRSLVHAALVSMSFVVFACGQNAHAALVADYLFRNDFTSYVPGAPALVQSGPGPGTFGTDTILGNPVNTWTFPEHTGLAFNNSLATIANDEYTAVMEFKVPTLGTHYRALVMTENFSNENHFYITNTNRLQPWPYSTGSGVLSTNTYYTVALTRTASNIVKTYLNGVLQTTNAVPSTFLKINGAELMHFFRDNTNAEETAGTVSRIQLYNAVLSDAQIAALNLSAEPVPPAPEPSTLVAAALGLISLRTLRRRRR